MFRLGEWLVAVGVLVAAVGCSNKEYYDCELRPGCLQGGIAGVCLESPVSDSHWCGFPDPSCPGGNRYGILSGDGLASECVAAAASDAGLEDAGLSDDAGTTDAAVDAAPGPDALLPDAAPAVPPVVNGQSANLVLGQPNFLSQGANSGGLSSSSISSAWSVASDGSRLWVADGDPNLRVMQWNALPSTNKAAANVVIGKSSFASTTHGPTQSLVGPGNQLYVATGGGRLVVADETNNRVLVWNTIPSANGTPASLVLGQSNFTGNAQGKGASNLAGPRGIWTDGTRLVVADFGNNRVLIWNTFPVMNGQAANVVLGRSAFGQGSGDPIANPPNASTMEMPVGVYFDGQNLYVADAALCRVAVWKGMPTQFNQPADFMIGQPSASAKDINAGGAVSALGLNSPWAAVVAGNSLFVSDYGNSRVLVYTPVPTDYGDAADAVLGQNNLTSAVEPTAPAANRLRYPFGLFAIGTSLWVSDGYQRVLRFQLTP